MSLGMAFLFKGGLAVVGGGDRASLAVQTRVASTLDGRIVDHVTRASMRMVREREEEGEAASASRWEGGDFLVGDATRLSPGVREAYGPARGILVPLRPSSSVARQVWKRATRVVPREGYYLQPVSEADAAKVARGFLREGVILVEPRSDLRRWGYTHLVCLNPEKYSGVEIYEAGARLAKKEGLDLLVAPLVPYAAGPPIREVLGASEDISAKCGIRVLLALAPRVGGAVSGGSCGE